MEARGVFLLLALSVGAAALGAHAQTRIYTCKDASGKTITSDRPLPECVGREGRVLSPQGTTVKKIDAPLTPEQIAAREAEERKKKEEDERQREQMRKDKALLNTYSGLDDIESKRQRALAQVEREVRESEKRISLLERQAAENRSEAEFYKKRALPPELKRRVDENEAALKAEKLLYGAKKNEVTQVNVRFDEDRRRYAELTGAGPTDRAPARKP
ncbi:MAG: DUF4124 domain-containing protein [Burkholderiales bacterium]|nr:DUF4124 domain-containing protein [Burkholderiales bacterium]